MPVAFTIQIEVNPAAARAVALDAAERLVTDTTRRVFNRAIVLTPVDTGNLRAQNNMRVQRTATGALGEVFNDTTYAAAVHNGSKAYTIRPKRKKALRWVGKGGEVVFAKSARHKATRGRPWLTRALTEVAGAEGFTVTT